MRFLLATVIFSFLLTTSYSSFLETDVTPHLGSPGTELTVNYSFDNYHGNGYLRFYAIKCKIGYSLRCSFSENNGEILLFERDDFDFEDGETKIIIPEIEGGLYRVCTKAYNHSNYATDCDSHNYFLLQGDEPSDKLTWKLGNYTSAVKTGEEFNLSFEIFNPTGREINITIFSYVYTEKNGIVTLVSDSWENNRREISLAPNSAVSITLQEKGMNMAGNFSLGVKLLYEGRTEFLKLPIKVEEEEGKKIKIINLNYNELQITFEIANLGMSEEKISMVIEDNNETFNSSFILKPKEQQYIQRNLNSPEATLILFSGDWFFVRKFSSEEIGEENNCSCVAENISSGISGFFSKKEEKKTSFQKQECPQNIKKEENTGNSVFVTLTLQSLALVGLLLMLKMVK